MQRRRRCQHCRGTWASETFDARMCAEKRRRRTVHLCSACDVKLNALVLEFVNAPSWQEKVAAYAPAERGQE